MACRCHPRAASPLRNKLSASSERSAGKAPANTSCGPPARGPQRVQLARRGHGLQAGWRRRPQNVDRDHQAEEATFQRPTTARATGLPEAGWTSSPQQRGHEQPRTLPWTQVGANAGHGCIEECSRTAKAAKKPARPPRWEAERGACAGSQRVRRAELRQTRRARGDPAGRGPRQAIRQTQDPPQQQVRRFQGAPGQKRSFAMVQADARSAPQSLRQAIKKEADAAGPSDDVNIIEVGQQQLVGLQTSLDFRKRVPHAKGVKGRHQRVSRVSLLPPLSLRNGMGCAFKIMPDELRRRGVEQTDEGETAVSPQRLQHGPP